jgi:hypothetical protein
MRKNPKHPRSFSWTIRRCNLPRRRIAGDPERDEDEQPLCCLLGTIEDQPRWSAACVVRREQRNLGDEEATSAGATPRTSPAGELEALAKTSTPARIRSEEGTTGRGCVDAADNTDPSPPPATIAGQNSQLHAPVQNLQKLRDDVGANAATTAKPEDKIHESIGAAVAPTPQEP